MKRLLLLIVTTFCSPAFVPPPQEHSISPLEGLTPELKSEIIRFLPQQGRLLNIPALAKSITSLAATSRPWYVAINDPCNMLIILRSLPRAGAVLLANGLRKMHVMKSDPVQKWLKSFTLEGGQELYDAINTKNPNIESIVKLLDNPNIDVNWKKKNVPNFGDTALIKAIFRKDINIVKLLLAAGADVNLQNADGYTALAYASMDGNLGMVELFLEAGADPLIRNSNGKSILDSARTFAGSYPKDPKKTSEYIPIIKSLEAAEKAHKEKQPGWQCAIQ